MITFDKLLDSKKRYCNLSYSSPKIARKINELVLKCLGKNINLNHKDDLKSLTLSDLKRFDKNVRSKYQKSFVNILKPEIKKITKNVLDEYDLSDFRVGSQCKYKKETKKLYNQNSKDHLVERKVYDKALGDSFYHYLTLPHQDLSSNGFRSSSVLIFYFQLTPTFNDTCVMQISKFKNKVGLYKENRQILGNELHYVAKNNIKEKFKWQTPKSLEPGKILLMDSMTLHKSDEINLVPRLALNVKIQPKSLNYIYKIYNLKKKFKPTNKIYNLNILENDLDKVTKFNNAINFELSMINVQKNNFKEAKARLNQLCLYKPTQFRANQILAGGQYRVTLEQLKPFHIANLKKRYNYEHLSCAHAIINTLN